MKPTEDQSDTPSARLNPFILPTPTTVLFLLIVGYPLLYFCLTPFSGSGRIPLPLFFLLVFLFFEMPFAALALRSFLRDPERQIQKHKMVTLEQVSPGAARLIQQLASEMGLKIAPQAMWTANRSVGAYAFGTFRHWYIAISDTILAEFGRRGNQLEAIILHELSHFKNGDVWKYKLAEKFAKTFLVAGILYIVVGVPYALTTPGGFRPAIRDNMLFSSAALLVWPVSVLIMYGNMSLLLKVRELFADARVRIHAPTNVDPLRRAMTSSIWRRPQFALGNTRLGFVQDSKAYSAFKRIFPHQPKVVERDACLHSDIELYRTVPLPAIAGAMLGSLGLVLIAPPLSFLTLIESAAILGLIVNSVVLLPESCVGFMNFRRALLSSVRVAFLFSAASYLSFMVFQLMPWLFVSRVDIVESATTLAIFFVSIGLFLTLCLSFHSWLRAAILRWYSLDLVQKHPNLFLIVIPLCITIAPLPALWYESTIVGSLSIILTIAMSLVILLLHLRYANRCPACSSRVRGRFVLGYQCPECHFPLNRWLQANYSAKL